jgi:hypothetical protein
MSAAPARSLKGSGRLEDNHLRDCLHNTGAGLRAALAELRSRWEIWLRFALEVGAIGKAVQADWDKEVKALWWCELHSMRSFSKRAIQRCVSSATRSYARRAPHAPLAALLHLAATASIAGAPRREQRQVRSAGLRYIRLYEKSTKPFRWKYFRSKAENSAMAKHLSAQYQSIVRPIGSSFSGRLA